jgi:sulfur carrier protein ThiS
MIVKLTGEFATLTGKREVEIFAPTNIKNLLTALDTAYPNYGWDNCNVAINGTMYSNAWLQPISWKDEIVIMPLIEGG